jgi:hypothetical protein
MRFVTPWRLTLGFFAGLLLLFYYYVWFSDAGRRDACGDRGGCWDRERNGCVFVKVPFQRELQPTPYQEATGSCLPPPQP